VSATQHIRISNPWHAVGIRTASRACPVCKALAGRRFLSREAPSLPLAGCLTPAVCRTVYEHFDDRRDGPRRGVDHEYPSQQAPPPGGLERRRAEARGRRSTDATR